MANLNHRHLRGSEPFLHLPGHVCQEKGFGPDEVQEEDQTALVVVCLRARRPEDLEAPPPHPEPRARAGVADGYPLGLQSPHQGVIPGKGRGEEGQAHRELGHHLEEPAVVVHVGVGGHQDLQGFHPQGP